MAKGKFKNNPKMVLLKSVIEKETDEGRLCRFYASPDECQKFAKLLEAVETNSARIDVHIRDREGDSGSFTSGFIFMDETDGPTGGKGGKKKYGGFKDKTKDKPSKKAAKKAKYKAKYAGKRKSEEE